MSKYDKHVTETRLKKFYSVISNAIKLSEDENGEMYFWTFPSENYDSNIVPFFRKYYLPYLNVAGECNHPNCFSKENYVFSQMNGVKADGIVYTGYIVKLIDGTYIYFLPNTPNGYLWLYVDINGRKKPNIIGRDIFIFDIYSYPNNGVQSNYRLKFWGNHLESEERLYVESNYGCNKSSPEFAGFYCGELIFRNGWKIPDNYPW